MSGAEIDRIRRELTGRLRGSRPVRAAAALMRVRFRDFADALARSDLRSLLRAVTLIHHDLSKLLGDEEADAICDRLQEFIPAAIKAELPQLTHKEIFFVWIGAIGNRSLRNILVWQKANPDYSVHLWFDSHCLLASHYSRLLKDRAGLRITSNDGLVQFQNEVHAAVQAMVAAGLTFDEALISFFRRRGDGRIARNLETARENAERRYRSLAGCLSLRDMRDHAATIMDDEFRRYYFREIALRANLAAASDILRLNVIHRFGGVYVDCDTLPSLDHVFVKTGAYCRNHAITSGFIDVLESEAYLRTVAPLIDPAGIEPEPSDEAMARQADIEAISGHLTATCGEVVALIEQDAAAITAGNAFRPLDDIRLCDQGLLLTGDPHNRNGFNNNVIIASPGSRTVRIVLREMRHRYRYLDRMGAVDIGAQDEVPVDDSYKGRLLHYRFDALDDRSNVTVLLTGPGLIFEVLMGLGFGLLKLDDEVSPVSLSYALYSPKIGIAFMDQTFHTYDHSQSAWLRGVEGALLV